MCICIYIYIYKSEMCVCVCYTGTHLILNTDDTAGYDLTIDGAGRINEQVHAGLTGATALGTSTHRTGQKMSADPTGSAADTPNCETYYFTIPCQFTRQFPGCYFRHHLPQPTRLFWMVPFGALSACLTSMNLPCPTQRTLQTPWNPALWTTTDLLVPWHSQIYPHVGLSKAESPEPIWLGEHWEEEFKHSSKGFQAGVWHILPTCNLPHGTKVLDADPLRDMLLAIFAITHCSPSDSQHAQT